MASAGTGELIPESNTTNPEIVALYPNTVHDYNRGEFLIVHVPRQMNLSNWRFRDDGRQWAKPPPIEANGTIAFSFEPALAGEYLDIPVYELDGWFQMAVDGESVRLEIDDVVVDAVSYDDRAPQAHLWIRDRAMPWVHLGATAFEPVSATADGQVFVLPDAPAMVTRFIENASTRLYLGGYELGDPRVVDALIDAADRGVDVIVHAEGRPVGGIADNHGRALDQLDDAGIEVTVHYGDYRRWGYHHPKYVIGDESILITTENFKPAGTGGQASRGWGIILTNETLATAATEIFEADSTWRDAIPWSSLRGSIARFPEDGALGTYESRHQPLKLAEVNASLIVAPEAAEENLIALIDAAEQSIHIKQVRVSDIDFPLMASAIDRARTGVSVRILLSGRWYVKEENEAFAEEVTDLADAAGLDIEVALTDDTARFNRIHAKGLIVDEERVVIGSINWNNHSLRQNREMAVIVDDERAAGYYLEVFEGDWSTAEGSTWQIPIGLLLASLAACGLTVLHAYRLRMEGPEAATEEELTEVSD